MATKAERQARHELETILPFGVWRSSDGAAVLFNMAFKPLWAAAPGGEWRACTGPSDLRFLNGGLRLYSRKEYLRTQIAKAKARLIEGGDSNSEINGTAGTGETRSL